MPQASVLEGAGHERRRSQPSQRYANVDAARSQCHVKLSYVRRGCAR